ncbi:E3 ubiquitin-protein ligase RNF181 [Ricinus communis]|uniref:RING-type E3 ubiquitin transferase n=1 Tax=Ricinus communis TaxID=3988 RepID=B9RKI3_RICCO|nr:E3 ubiquitin-protein ligase RNF181 [Ricinus communis]EEF48181.1 zinc finger protein, putative [Ricinus communis]|eukprot:XP_002514227.1 E3 ubiquitin-protein ligase RNF181 [Ricinus communis]
MATVSSNSKSNAFSTCIIDVSFDMEECLTLPHNFLHQISVSNSLVANMPMVSVSTEDDDSVCSVCMEGFQSDMGGKQVQCGHVYHAACISSWLSNSSSCPLCRFNIFGS